MLNLKLLIIFAIFSTIKCESLCDCGGFEDIKVTKNENKFNIDVQQLKDFLTNPLIDGSRLYIVGNYGETDVLNGVILNELYENYKSINSPDCLVHKSKFTSLVDSKCSGNSSQIQLWNDIFMYESQNKVKIAMIFMSFKARAAQTQVESRIFSALSGLASTIYFMLSEESFYDEYFGKEAQECDFHFHINELDQRNEIDESILEIHSILSHQNIEMHEDLHFVKENLKISNFLDVFQFGVEKISQIEVEIDVKLRKFVENLKEFVEKSEIFDEKLIKNDENSENLKEKFDNLEANSENSDESDKNFRGKLENFGENSEKFKKSLKIEKNSEISPKIVSRSTNFNQVVTKALQIFKEQAVNIYMNQTSPQLTVPDSKTPKIQRKMKIFIKKLRQIERIVTSKVQTFITEVVDEYRRILTSKTELTDSNIENHQLLPQNLTKIIDTAALKLFDSSSPTEEKIRTGSARNYIKTLQKLFETSNNEIRKSIAFKKLMKQRKISIPLPCDVKC